MRISNTASHVPRNLLYKTGYLFARMGRFLTKKSTILETICALLIILFIYTGLNKMMDYENFKVQMGRSPYLENINNFVAATLPTGELLIALAIIIKRTRLLGLYLSFFLMSLFTGYIWIMLHESYYLPCSCGGILAAMSWEDHFIFNSIFTGLTIVGILLQNKILKR